MQKKIIVICILGMFLLSVTGISAFSTKIGISNLGTPPKEEWTKTFGGIKYDFGTSVQQTSDEGYVLTGCTWSFGAKKLDAWLIKTDEDGNELWNKTYGGAEYDFFRTIQQTSDGGYIIVGETESFGAGGYDIWLMKIDSNGEIEWDKTFGGISNDGGNYVQQTNDGGYIIVGTKWILFNDVWLIKTDSEGNLEWDKTFGESKRLTLGDSVKQTNDGGYVIIGAKASLFGYADAWLIKTDSAGNKLWDKSFGGDDDDGCFSGWQTSDGGYILAGLTLSFGAGRSDAWLIKTDSSGKKLWEKTFGGSNWDDGLSVDKTSDGGYIITGSTQSFGAGGQDVWLIKTDSEGNKLWGKTFGGTDNDRGASVQQTDDDAYIVAGSTQSFGAGQGDIWLIKTPDFENQRPNSITIDGPPSGNVGESYVYIFSASDPDGEDVYYWIDWGDCNKEEWIGPYSSGETIEVSHTWTKKGTYNVKVKAMDTYGGESDWETLTVTMPRKRATNNSLFLKLLEQFPILQTLLQRLELQ